MQSPSNFRQPAQARRILATVVVTTAVAAMTAGIALNSRRAEGAGPGQALVSPAPAGIGLTGQALSDSSESVVMSVDPELGYVILDPSLPVQAEAAAAPRR
jgi:hypothetical protein